MTETPRATDSTTVLDSQVPTAHGASRASTNARTNASMNARTNTEPPATSPLSPATRRRRSILAVATGFVTVAVLSLLVDEVLHLVGVYQPWGEPMREPSLNLLALSYRSVITVFGMYLTARMAPQNGMRHALVGGAIGTVVATAGAFATIPMHLGPAWYPIALAATALPLSWLGGAIARARAVARS